MAADSFQKTWREAPGRLLLEDGEVHVWRACLNQTPSTTDALRQTLAPEERERAGKFYFDEDREHFVVARGVLREILGRYISVAPERITFSYNEFGKPCLGDGASGNHLRFNVSHSREVALYAFTRGREVGLDVEFVRADFATTEIAERFFSRVEVEMLAALPPEQRTNGFFNCWTRKEAYIKALGEGLSHPLSTFAVSLVPGEPAALLSTGGGPEETARWTLTELFPGPDYAGALAVEGRAASLTCWQWSDESRGPKPKVNF